MGLYFFKSGKETGERLNIYKDQIYITIKKEKVLHLLSNIIKSCQNSDEKDTFDMAFSGELKK